MQINESVINGFEINEENYFVDGTLITIGKNIEYNISQVETTIISIEKTIANSQSGTTLITIGKKIQSGANTFYTRNNWEPIIQLGAITLAADELTGGIRVTKSEGDNSTAEFSIILSPNTYNLYDFQGQNVTIFVREAPTGLITKLFSGKVDIPTVNVIEEKLTLNCVADRRVLLQNLGVLELFIGYYSESVFGKNPDVVDRINNRMTTIPSSLDFDSSNNYQVTSWTPKASPDFIYGSSDVYRRNPQLSVDSSGQILNKATITVDYSYQRHHARYAFYQWTHTYCPTDYVNGIGGICPFLIDAPTYPTKDMIKSAIKSAGWPLTPQSLYFGKIFRSGSYNCSGTWAQWSTIKTNYSNAPKLNADGSAALDSNGKPIYTTSITSEIDETQLYTMFAQWVASKTFNQNVTERYTVTVQSPESITRYGVLPLQESYGYNGQETYSNWETDQAYIQAPAGVTKVTDTASGSFWFNDDLDRSLFNIAYNCAIHKAQTSILKTHRNTRINFQRPLTSNMELKHTVSLTGKWIKGKGKCNTINHYLNISDNTNGIAGEAYTDVTLLQYRGNTTISDTPLIPTTPPADTYIPVQNGAILETHLGQDPSSDAAVRWTGYIGNKVISTVKNGSLDHSRTFYPESFVVDTPGIPDSLRSDRILAKSVSYNVNIPNDDTEYESYG